MKDETVDERAVIFRDELGIPVDAARNAARDSVAPTPTRKPASNDVENERIAAAEAAKGET